MPPRSILAKSASAFRFTPRKCAGRLRYPKEGFCYCMREGIRDGHKGVDGLVFSHKKKGIPRKTFNVGLGIICLVH